MLILRIKQAETALADGRLDEAFELLQASDLRTHRRGQELIGELARVLVERGKTHQAAGRVAQAMADCEKAGRLGGNLPEVAELRAAVAGELAGKQTDQQQRAQRLAAARAQIEQGQLSVGAGLLAEAGAEDPQGRALLEDVQIRTAAAEAALAKAAGALGRDDWEAAIDQLAQAKRLHPSDERLVELLGRISRLVIQKMHEALNGGRLDLAQLLLSRLRKLGERTVEIEEAQRVLDECRAAWEYIDRAQPRQAEHILRRLAQVLPDAKWLGQTLASVEQVGEAIEQVRSSPLGFLDARRTVAPEWSASAVSASQHGRLAATRPAPAIGPVPMAAIATAEGEGLPKRFLLQVDGAGSFCVLRGTKVNIGPVSGGMNADLGLLIEPTAAMVSIERAEEDYFLRAASRPVEVNGRACTSKLLASGDRVALSPRCRIAFALPNPASTSAVLDLAGARHPRGDVRRAILLDREILIGAGPAAHVRVDTLSEPVVLHVRDGRLYCQAKQDIAVNEQPAGREAEVAVGAHVRVGSLSFVVTAG